MRFGRRFPIAPFVLVMYLVTSVVGEGLHHHGGTPSSHGGGVQGVSRSTDPAAGDDHGDRCAVCTALHQARPLPTVFTFEPVSVPLGEVLPAPAATLPPPVRTIPHARAPPAV